MSLREALDVLGVAPGVPLAEVRASYRRQVRRVHPDLVDAEDAGARTARVTAAFTVVETAIRTSDGDVVPEPAASDDEVRRTPDRGGQPRWNASVVEADTLDHETISIAAPVPEAFSLILDAASSIGAVGYVDRHLGILEVLVRFAGGPTCSVLVTLQDRVHTTEASCTIDSIEAAPAPPLRPVVEALVAELVRPR
jgi:hypothetical protein